MKQRKVLIVDDNHRRYQSFFVSLRKDFPQNIDTLQQAEEVNIFSLDIDMLIIHENNDFSPKLIQQSKERNLYIISYAGAEHIDPEYKGRELYVNYDDHIKPNLKYFLKAYFDGIVNFDILMYGRLEAEHRTKVLNIKDYIDPLTHILHGLQIAFDLNKPEIFLGAKEDENDFIVDAQRILRPDFFLKMETALYPHGSASSDRIEKDVWELLFGFAEILRAPIWGNLAGVLNCDHSKPPCGNCFLCQIQYHKGKSSQFYQLKENLNAYLKEISHGRALP